MAYTCGCEVNKCQGFSFWDNIDQMAHFYLGPYSTKFCLILLKFWPEVASNKTNTVFGKSIKIYFAPFWGPIYCPKTKNQKPKSHNSSKIKQKKKKKKKMRLNCRVFQIAIRNGEGGIRNFAGGEYFHRAVRAWGGVLFTIRTFFKARNRFLILNINWNQN